MPKLTETKQGEQRTVSQRLIPDPLEGVVEGGNRHERYVNFVETVLGKIWPPTSDSGEYGNDFWRSKRYDRRLQKDAQPNEWIGGYTQFSPQGKDPLNLSSEEFEIFVQNVGTPDYIRVRSIPPQLLISGVSVVPVGGSCALETNSMRTAADIRTCIEVLTDKLNHSQNGTDPSTIRQEIDHVKELLANFARTSVSMAPTISHASGALLGGSDVNVHYWETDMWRERLEKEMGLDHAEAQKIVQDAYQRIHTIVQRRSSLINPNSTVLQVNFDELHLDPAIKRWAQTMGLDLNDHRVIEVIYTYVGPEQLDLLKNALAEKQQKGKISAAEIGPIEKVMAASLHLRGKQIDHLRWGSMNLPKEVILGLRDMTPDEQNQYDNDYAFRMGIIIMSDVYQRHTSGNPTSIALGFADLPASGNEVQHESRDVGFTFTGQSPAEPVFLESMNQQLHNPSRLNWMNVDEHLNYLRRYTSDNTGQRKLLLARMNILQGQIKPYEAKLSEAKKKLDSAEKKVNQYDASIDEQRLIITFARSLTIEGKCNDTPENRSSAKKIRERAEKSLKNSKDKQSYVYVNDNDQQDIDELPDLIAAMLTVEKGGTPTLTAKAKKQLEKFPESSEKLTAELEKFKASKRPDIEQAKVEVNSRLTDLEKVARDRQELVNVREQLATKASPNYFPLSDNPFIQHAMQFLWDPDFTTFMKKAVITQEARAKKESSKEQSNEQMRILMEQIYPKLEAYIQFLYGKIDYPDDIKNTRIFS